MKTPYFLIHEEELNKNINAFKDALDKLWPNSEIAYSIKTNSLPWVLKHMKSQGIMAEAVSDEEYELAKLCGFDDSEIIYNGPIKSSEQLIKALNTKAIINVDSKNDIQVIKDNKTVSELLGIRINVDTSFFDIQDISFEDDGFRFGFSDTSGELEETIEVFREIYGQNSRFGLHLHCNSKTRSVNVYSSIARYAAYIIEKYKLNVSFIDIGGGFFGGVEGKPTPENYILAIRNELEEIVNIEQTKLILEPGSAFIGSVVDLYTSVIDAKEIKNARIVTTDGSRIHIDPLWKKSGYMYSLKTSDQELTNRKQIICGYTCMDYDRIMTLTNKPELRIGDKLIYHRVGAYSMTFGGMFIRYYPDVYVKVNNSVKKVRERIDVKRYYDIQSVE